MEDTRGYDVLKLVERGGRCYMSTDLVSGRPMVRRLRDCPQVSRELLYRWIREFLEELERFHRCRGNPCYQYVNPYSIIVGMDERLYLLDLGSRDQEELLHLMQRRHIREKFLSPDNQYYQKTSVREDLYGAGRTIQYLLSEADPEPRLGKWEEFRLQRVIDGCLAREPKKGFQTAREAAERVPKRRGAGNPAAGKEKKKKSKKGSAETGRKRKAPVKKAAAAAVILLVVGTGGAAAGWMIREQEEAKGEIEAGDLSDKDDNEQVETADQSGEIRRLERQWAAEKQEIEETGQERERTLACELALVYFTELEDYEKSAETLEDVEKPDQFVEDFEALCRYLSGEMPRISAYSMKQILKRMEQELPDPEDERYELCLAKGYQAAEEAAASESSLGDMDSDSQENSGEAKESAGGEKAGGQEGSGETAAAESQDGAGAAGDPAENTQTEE